MTDRDFELLLEEEITALPPGDELVADITPWRQAVHRILWGMALCGITFRFLLLDYILPTVGVMMILLGFRTLRRENRWFMAGYIAATVRAASSVFTLILNATLWAGEFYDSAAGEWLTILGVCITVFHALCIWGGFRAVRQRVGVEETSNGFWLVIYYILLTVLAIAEFEGLIVVAALLVVYILLLRSLWKYAALLDEAGYAVQASPVRLSDRSLTLLLTAVTAIGIGCGYLFCNQYPMDWTPREVISAEAAEIKADLRQRGFPEYVLDDLTEEDILACRGAKTVYVEKDEEAFNKGVQITESDGNATYIHTEYPVKELLVTHVAVRPAEGNTWLVFHHFLWQKDPGFRGTDALKIWPTYQSCDGWAKGSYLSGQVLHDRKGVSYAAPFYDLEEKTYTAASFFGAYETTDIIAAFSLPAQGDNCRGYVCYDMEMVEEGWVINSWCNYFYQQMPSYPLQSAQDYALSVGGGSNTFFKNRQTAIQMWPDEEGVYTPVE